MFENFPKLISATSLQIQEPQRTSSRRNTTPLPPQKSYTLMYHFQTTKIKDKEKILKEARTNAVEKMSWLDLLNIGLLI